MNTIVSTNSCEGIHKTITVGSTPIKCGLRNSKTHLQTAPPTPLPHWSFNPTTDSSNKRLRRHQNSLHKLESDCLAKTNNKDAAAILVKLCLDQGCTLKQLLSLK